MLTRLSKYYSDLGELVPAYEFNRRAGEAYEKGGFGATIDRLVTLNNEAIDLVSFGEVVAAAEIYADLIRRMEARGPSTRTSFHANYGITLALLGRTDEALRMLEESKNRSRAVQSAFWENRARFFMARALIIAGKFDEAGKELDAAEEVYRRDEAMNRVNLRGIALTRSALLLRTGRVAEAKKIADQLLAEVGYPAQTTPAAPLVPILRQAAFVALAAGDLERAESLAMAGLERAQALARSVDRSADVGQAHLLLGKVRLAQGQAESGRTEIAAALPGLTNGLGP